MDNKNINLFNSNVVVKNISFDEMKNELMTLFKSPNPLQIYLNSQKIKNIFSDIILNLTFKIKDGFKIDDSEEKTFLMTIYKQSNYEQVWIDIIEYYLRDSKNFDLLSYLYYVILLNKDKQYLAKSLLKLYKWEKEEDIKNYLVKYNSKVTLNRVKEIYNEYEIWKMQFSINLREDFIEHFLEKIYINLDKNKRVIFLDNFIVKINKNNVNFNDLSKIVSKIISNYTTWYKFTEIKNTIDSEYFSDVKLLIDDYIKKYNIIRWDFYIQVTDTLWLLNQTDRSMFWQYIKTKMIDLYYSDIKYLFYEHSSNQFLDKNNYSLLKWDFKLKEILSPEAQYISNEYKEINDLREIILELSDNLFSFFLLPIIYYTLSEKLSIKKMDLYKMKYLLLFIFCENYSEYKKVYMFFNQLEVFLNYDKKPKIFEKLKVSASIILTVILILIISYFYFPFWVFVWITVLSLIKWYEVIYPNEFYNSKLNIWIKFFAIVFLSVSTYFWFSNFDKLKWDTANLTAQIKVLWTISSKEALNNTLNYLKTSLLDVNNIK